MKIKMGLLGSIGGALLGLGYESYKSHVAKKTTEKAVRAVMDSEVKDMIRNAFQNEYKNLAEDEVKNVIAALLTKD